VASSQLFGELPINSTTFATVILSKLPDPLLAMFLIILFPGKGAQTDVLWLFQNMETPHIT
jgi:hypothetical protein